MIVEFDKSFLKSLNKINNTNILIRIEKLIIKLESAKALQSISNCKKLIGFEYYYRIKIGDYRIGFEKINNEKLNLLL